MHRSNSEVRGKLLGGTAQLDAAGSVKMLKLGTPPDAKTFAVDPVKMLEQVPLPDDWLADLNMDVPNRSAVIWDDGPLKKLKLTPASVMPLPGPHTHVPIASEFQFTVVAC